jgi:hypothetical protein
VPVPHSFGIDHHRGPVLALIQAQGFVDAHRASQSGSLGKLLQLRMQFALSIARARGPGRAFWTDIMANKYVMLEWRQTSFLLPPAYLPAPGTNFSHLHPPTRLASAKMIA